MLKLHFLRHGQTDFNLERRVQGQYDSQLTEMGVSQAKAAAQMVATLDIKSAYSSTNLRAKHTAQLAIDGLGLELKTRDGLREIMMGAWQQQLYADVRLSDPERLNHFQDAPHKFHLDGAETFQDLQARGVKAVEEIIAAEMAHIKPTDSAPRNVLIVSHGAILKTIFAHYAAVPLSDIWAEPHLQNCSHSLIEVSSDNARSLVHIAGEKTDGTIWDQA